MEFRKIATIEGGQDGAVALGYLFRFDKYGKCKVYKTGDLLSAEGKRVAPISSFDLDQLLAVMPHSNSVSFGHKLLPTDEFPLLYTNVYNNYSGLEDNRPAELCVYRIKRCGYSFSASLFQRIRLSFARDIGIWRSGTQDVRPYGNFLFDPASNRLYAYVMRDKEAVTRVFAIRPPKMEVGDYILGEDSIIEYFDIPYTHYMQGGCIHGGCLYSLEGFSKGENRPAIRIIDLGAKRQIAHRQLSDFGLKLEPEMIDFKGEICLYSDCDGNLYTVSA